MRATFPMQLALLLALGLASARPSQAAWPPDGVPLCGGRPACDATFPVPAPDGTGGAFVVWADNRASPTSAISDIFMQRVMGTGEIAPGWPATGLPVCTDPAWQGHSLWSVVPDGFGGVIMAWQDQRNDALYGTGDIYAQRILADGSLAPGWAVNGVPVTRLPWWQSLPVALADGTGGAYFTWDDDYADDIRVQRLGPDGQPAPGWPEDGLAVCTDPFVQGSPELASDGQGGVIVAWADGRVVPPGAFAQRVLPTGEIAPGWPVNGVQIAGRYFRGVVSDGAGGAYLCSATAGPFFDASLYVQRFTGSGAIAPGWPAGGAEVCTAPDDRSPPRLVADGQGGVLLTWYDYRDLYDDEIFVQRIGPERTRYPGWPADGLRVTDNQLWDHDPDLAPDGSGGVYLCWDQNLTRVMVQHLTGAGEPAPGWPAGGMAIPSQEQFGNPHITADGFGGAVVVWETYSRDIRALRFVADGPTPVQVALVSAEASPERVRLTWHAAGGGSIVARVERRTEGGAWEGLGAAEASGDGYLRFEDRAVVPGSRYAYRLAYRDGESERFSAESWVEVPSGLELALEGFRPNPAVGEPLVAFTLPRAGAAQLELWDLGGRRRLAQEVGALGAGRHLVRLSRGSSLPAGMYWLRLRQGGESAGSRGLIVR